MSKNEPGTADGEPTEIEIEAEASAEGLQIMTERLASFVESLDGGRYEFEAEITERDS